MKVLGCGTWCVGLIYLCCVAVAIPQVLKNNDRARISADKGGIETNPGDPAEPNKRPPEEEHETDKRAHFVVETKSSEESQSHEGIPVDPPEDEGTPPVEEEDRRRRGPSPVENKPSEESQSSEGIPVDPPEHEGAPPVEEEDRRRRKRQSAGKLKNMKKMKKVHRKSSQTSTYISFGLNLALLFEENTLYDDTPRKNKFRDGFAADTDSCDDIREVPAQLRDPEYFFDPVHITYQKYTEAYDIPILGSADVTDEGLRRACYEIKFLLASRYDIRNVYYWFYGRVALIADNEEQTSLWEYHTWDPIYWNERARGLGPTVTIPLTSAGDDNQRCKAGDIYSKQDILVHEFCHAMHLVGAVHAIEGFQRRLISAFNDAMNNGRFQGAYAATNQNEYFAVGCQLYFDSLRSKGITFTNVEGETVEVSNRDTLQMYDPALVELLNEVFPCPNSFVHRCTWKDCDSSNFDLVYDKSVNAKSQCTVLKATYNKADASACAEYTCFHRGNAFNYKKTTRAMYCYALECKNLKDLEITQNSGAFDVYKIKAIPQMDFSAGKRCTVATADRVKYGPTPTKDNQATCESRGGCFESGYGCYYPTQELADRGVSCYNWATEGDTDKCLTNPAFMLKNCPLSCNAVKWSYRVHQNLEATESLCQDGLGDCQDTDCPKYGNNYCKLHCKTCSLESNWKTTMGIADLNITPMIKKN